MKSFRKFVPKKFRREIKQEKKIIKKINKQRRIKPTVVGKALRSVGRLAGNYLGVGGLGEAVGAGVSRIFGQGDYVMPQRNSLLVNGVPSFSPLTSGFRLRHREYITDIQSSIGFASTSYSINPGLNDLFPWLSAVAQNFEEYKIHGMVVYLNTTAATAVSSTNTALGLWGVVTQYDPSEIPFTTKQQCENYVGCQTSVPSCSLIHGIECKPSANVLDKYFVRSGINPSAEDLKFYDLGKIQVFTQGSQAVSTIGEMWISYDIEFMKPRLPTSGENAVFTDRYYSADVDLSHPLGNTRTLAAGSNLGTTINSAGTIITIPATAPNTNYVLVMGWHAVTPYTSAQPAVFVGGSLVSKLFFGNSSSYRQGPQVGLLLVTDSAIAFTFAKTSDTIGTLTVSTCNATNGNMDILLTQVSANYALQDKFRNTKLDIEELAEVRKLLKQMRPLQIQHEETKREQSPKYYQEWPKYDPYKQDEPVEDSFDESGTSYSELEVNKSKGGHVPKRLAGPPPLGKKPIHGVFTSSTK